MMFTHLTACLPTWSRVTHIHPDIVPMITSVATTSSSVCSKCGKFKKSGTVSCCAKGGAWFGDCGNDGDAEYGHTFKEGIQACKSKFKKFQTTSL